jgi:hypothetical protein
MSHTLDPDGYYTPGPDERFSDPAIIAKVIELLQAHPSYVTAIVSAQWERKGQIQRGPLTEESVYRREGYEQYAISIELDMENIYDEDRIAAITGLVNEALIERADEAAHEELTRLEAERERLDAERARVESELAQLNARKKVLQTTPFTPKG